VEPPTDLYEDKLCGVLRVHVILLHRLLDDMLHGVRGGQQQRLVGDVRLQRLAIDLQCASCSQWGCRDNRSNQQKVGKV